MRFRYLLFSPVRTWLTWLRERDSRSITLGTPFAIAEWSGPAGAHTGRGKRKKRRVLGKMA